MIPPLKMYSKFVLPNYTVFSHILTMGQTIVTVTGDHYCELGSTF